MDCSSKHNFGGTINSIEKRHWQDVFGEYGTYLVWLNGDDAFEGVDNSWKGTTVDSNRDAMFRSALVFK